MVKARYFYDDTFCFNFDDVETFQDYYDNILATDGNLMVLEFDGNKKPSDPVPVKLTVIKGGQND